MPTIKEIADIVGVSRGTVDRVVNNRGGVKPETEARIRRVMDSMNYIPDPAGKTLAVKKKKLKFGIVLRYDNPRYQITDFVQRKARDFFEYGIETIILEAKINDPQSYLLAFQKLKENGVCGMIVMPEQQPEIVAAIEKMQKDGIQIVTVDSFLKDFHGLRAIGTDFYACGETIGSMLGLMTGAHGYTAIVSFPTERERMTSRMEGLRKRLAEAYPGIHIVDTIRTEDDDFSGYTKMKGLLEAHEEIETVFINSTSVTGTCRAIEETGRKIKVLCFDSPALPNVRTLVERGVIDVIVSLRSEYQVSLAMDTLFNYFVYGSCPESPVIYTKLDINVAGNLE